MKKFAKMAIAVAVAGFSVVSQAALVIDNFSDSQAKLSDLTSNALGYASTVGGGMLGGSRDLYVSKTGVPGDDGISGVNAFVNGAGVGRLSFSSDADQLGFAIVRWDGVSGALAPSVGDDVSEGAFNATRNATGLGGVNLLNYGNAFKIKVLNADAGFPFRLAVFTDASNYTTLDLISNAGPSEEAIDFSSFFGPAGQSFTPEGFERNVYGLGADFSNIGALEAVINVGGFVADVDLTIDMVRAVPEPESLALVGLGLLALGASRRRKSAS